MTVNEAFERGYLAGSEHGELRQKVAHRYFPDAKMDTRHDALIARIVASIPKPDIRHQPARQPIITDGE